MRSPALIAAALTFLAAGQAQAQDLLEAWNAARAADPVFGAARAGAEAGRTKIDQAKALARPQVTLNAGAGLANAYNKMSDAQFSAPGLGSASGATFKTKTDHGVDVRWNLNVEQPLFDAGRSTASRQLSRQAQLAEVKFSSEEQQLMLRVSKAYMDVLLAEDTLSSVKQQNKTVAEALASARERFKEGDVAIIDTHEAQARFDALVSQQLEAESNLQLAQAALADITGLASTGLARLPETTDLGKFGAGDLNDWLARAKQNSPSLHMQEINEQIARDEIEKHRASNAPVLSLVAQAGGEQLREVGGGMGSSLSNNTLSVGMQLTIPIFTGGMRDAKYGEAIALADQAREESEAVRIQSAQAARAAWMGVTVGHGKIKALEQAVISSKTKLDSTKLGMEIGDRTTLDVLNAVQDYAETRRELLRARYQLLLSFLGLAASAGELNGKILADVNAALVANAPQ